MRSPKAKRGRPRRDAPAARPKLYLDDPDLWQLLEDRAQSLGRTRMEHVVALLTHDVEERPAPCRCHR